jgi:hypothetical protein
LAAVVVVVAAVVVGAVDAAQVAAIRIARSPTSRRVTTRVPPRALAPIRSRVTPASWRSRGLRVAAVAVAVVAAVVVGSEARRLRALVGRPVT